ncbi:MAG: hypothetical protein J5529_04390 [Prevotella sp.]|nr:hypothetical protein [Prevotella sp.]
MKTKRQTYIPPFTELIFLEPINIIADSPIEEEKRRGYAVDNDEHEDEKIMSVWQQDDDDFLDID